MKAIVLSFDPHLEIANLLVESYNRLLPECPFHFRIPFTERNPKSIFRAKNVEFVRTPPEIRSTMENLLRDLPPDEFIFWCVDDRYPIEIFEPKILQAIRDFVSQEARDIDSIKLTDLAVEGIQGKLNQKTSQRRQSLTNASQRQGQTWRQREEGGAREPAFNLAGQDFFRQLGRPKNGFYMPQFTTPGFLRRFFFAPDLPANYRIREFHHFLLGATFEHRSYFPNKFLLTVGESTFAGRLSAACQGQMNTLGLRAPKIDVVDDYKIYSNRASL